MKASELIEELQKKMFEYGDIEVIDFVGNRIIGSKILTFRHDDSYIELSCSDDDGTPVLSQFGVDRR